MSPDLSWLLNGECRSVTIDISGTRFEFEDASLQLECPWRILSKGRIALGSVDHEQQFGLPKPLDAAVEALTLLKGQRVQSVVVVRESGDLVLHFSEDLRLEGWNHSSGYEGWIATGPNKQHVVAMGGGEVVVWG